MENYGITVSRLGTEPVKFGFAGATDFETDTNEDLFFSFWLSPKSDEKKTSYVVDISNQTKNSETGVILQFKSRSVFQLLNFNTAPDLEILKSLVYESYESHLGLFKMRVSAIHFLKDRTIAKITPELFEAGLKEEFVNKSFAKMT